MDASMVWVHVYIVCASDSQQVVHRRWTQRWCGFTFKLFVCSFNSRLIISDGYIDGAKSSLNSLRSWLTAGCWSAAVRAGMDGSMAGGTDGRSTGCVDEGDWYEIGCLSDKNRITTFWCFFQNLCFQMFWLLNSFFYLLKIIQQDYFLMKIRFDLISLISNLIYRAAKNQVKAVKI